MEPRQALVIVSATEGSSVGADLAREQPRHALGRGQGPLLQAWPFGRNYDQRPIDDVCKYIKPSVKNKGRISTICQKTMPSGLQQQVAR